MPTIISREQADNMDDSSLIWACIEPVIRQIRGKSFEVKSDVSGSLSPARHALLMFQVLYGHAREGVAGFLCGISYLLARKGMWQELRSGPKYFGDVQMVQLIGEMEGLYRIIEERRANVDFGRIDCLLAAIHADPELSDTMTKLDAKLGKLLPESVRIVAAYIKGHWGEFMET
jgi:hypothetical protein